jgi:hypothetical protein
LAARNLFELSTEPKIWETFELDLNTVENALSSPPGVLGEISDDDMHEISRSEKRNPRYRVVGRFNPSDGAFRFTRAKVFLPVTH